ncbi:MAG: hypothetical protein ACPG6R_11905 [Aequoribacter sp.]|uniref:hypothetical protein n=1 Tax=Aequoribacter sp. TaxID=2847771 RepID=UPI003C6431BD
MKHEEWVHELKDEERGHGKYRERARKFEKRYLAVDEPSNFNIFWSNVQIKQSALYSQTPKADVRRRYRGDDLDQNSAKNKAALILERALEFSIDQYDFDGVMNGSINTFLYAGLGQCRVNYDAFFGQGEPTFKQLETRNIEDVDKFFDGDEEIARADVVEDPQTGEPSLQENHDVIDFQQVTTTTVPWSRFRWSMAKDYETVWWQGEDHFLTDEQVRDTFMLSSEDHVPLAFNSNGDEKGAEQEGKLAKVTEVWDKKTREHFGMIDGLSKKLMFRAGEQQADDDPLGLQGFWPYPKPLFDNAVSGKWVPIPEYNYYQKQALHIEESTRRIEALTRELKWRGVKDGSFPGLDDVATAEDGAFVAVENFAARFGDKGLESVMKALPLNELSQTIGRLYESREASKQEVFEITGIADIVRGATNPNETLGAQQLKGQFANMRIAKQQKLIQQYVREIFRIKAEIIAEHFEPQVLELMTGEQCTPEIKAIMNSDVLRAFAVDIETDSTVIADQAQEQQNRVEVITSITELISAWAPMAAQQPQLVPVVNDMVQFLLGAFKAGSALEETFERLNESNQPAAPGLQGLAQGGVGGVVPGAAVPDAGNPIPIR